MLPSGGDITNSTPEHWRVSWPKTTTGPGSTTGTTMQVSSARWMPKDRLNIDAIVLGPGLQSGGQVQGLLGIADRDPANDLTPSTGGNPVSPDIDPSMPAYTQPLYRDFGRSWLVTTSAVRWTRCSTTSIPAIRTRPATRTSTSRPRVPTWSTPGRAPRA